MNDQKMKFKVGERIKIKKDLIVGEYYPMKHDVFTIERFTKFMNQFAGKEATVMEIVRGKYRLDIDALHLYTDEMLNKFVDSKAKSDYRITQQVEELIAHVSKSFPEQLINHALDTGNKEMFMRLTEKFNKIS